LPQDLAAEALAKVDAFRFLLAPKGRQPNEKKENKRGSRGRLHKTTDLSFQGKKMYLD
jgi:hypothetical protein